MFEQTGLFAGDRGLKEAVAFAFMKNRRFEKRNVFVEDGAIARDVHVVRHGMCKPAAVVGDSRADAMARFRQPPMLHVAFEELARGGA